MVLINNDTLATKVVSAPVFDVCEFCILLVNVVLTQLMPMFGFNSTMFVATAGSCMSIILCNDDVTPADC